MVFKDKLKDCKKSDINNVSMTTEVKSIRS
jgi:hypothetical protein